MIDCPQCGIVAAPDHRCPQTYVQKIQAENQRLRAALTGIYEHCLERATYIKGSVGDELEEVANMATESLLAADPGATGEGTGGGRHMTGKIVARGWRTCTNTKCGAVGRSTTCEHGIERMRCELCHLTSTFGDGQAVTAEQHANGQHINCSHP